MHLRVKLFGAICALVVSLQGCGSMQPEAVLTNPQSVASLVKVNVDDFKKETTYEGPNAARRYPGMVFLRAWKASDGTFSYQIYVADTYRGDWRFYDSAHDRDGNQLKTVQIKRKVDSCDRYGCEHTEHVGLTVTKKYLQQRLNEGLSFKVSGSGGDEIFDLPAAYVQGFLATAQ
jgi:hypothetical protein